MSRVGGSGMGKAGAEVLSSSASSSGERAKGKAFPGLNLGGMGGGRRRGGAGQDRATSSKKAERPGESQVSETEKDGTLQSEPHLFWQLREPSAARALIREVLDSLGIREALRRLLHLVVARPHPDCVLALTPKLHAFWARCVADDFGQNRSFDCGGKDSRMTLCYKMQVPPTLQKNLCKLGEY